MTAISPHSAGHIKPRKKQRELFLYISSAAIWIWITTCWIGLAVWIASTTKGNSAIPALPVIMVGIGFAMTVTLMSPFALAKAISAKRKWAIMATAFPFVSLVAILAHLFLRGNEVGGWLVSFLSAITTPVAVYVSLIGSWRYLTDYHTEIFDREPRVLGCGNEMMPDRIAKSKSTLPSRDADWLLMSAFNAIALMFPILAFSSATWTWILSLTTVCALPITIFLAASKRSFLAFAVIIASFSSCVLFATGASVDASRPAMLWAAFFITSPLALFATYRFVRQFMDAKNSTRVGSGMAIEVEQRPTDIRSQLSPTDGKKAESTDSNVVLFSSSEAYQRSAEDAESLPLPIVRVNKEVSD